MSFVTKFLTGLATPVQYKLYEHFCMRVHFAYLIFVSFKECFQQSQPYPVGLATVFDLTYFCHYYTPFQFLLVIGCFLYAVSPLIRSPQKRCHVLFAGTSIMAYLHILMNTQRNSRGVMGHSHQVVDLTLLVQFVYLLFAEVWCGILRKGSYQVVDNKFVYYSQQVIVATYVAAGISKERRSDWLNSLQFIMVKVIKSSEVPFYSGEVPKIEYNIWVRAMQDMVRNFPNFTIWMFGSALFLELFAFLFLYNRATRLLGGIALWIMHFMIAQLLHLFFISQIFQSMVVIYFINVPYWAVKFAKRFHRSMARNKSYMTLVSSFQSGCSRNWKGRSFVVKIFSPLWETKKTKSALYVKKPLPTSQNEFPIPLKLMCIMLLLCLPSADNYYPFSAFAMYSNIGKSSSFLYVKDAKDRIIDLPVVGLKCSQLMKYFNTVLEELKHHKIKGPRGRKEGYIRTLKHVYKTLEEYGVEVPEPLTITRRDYKWNMSKRKVDTKDYLLGHLDKQSVAKHDRIQALKEKRWAEEEEVKRLANHWSP